MATPLAVICPIYRACGSRRRHTVKPVPDSRWREPGPDGRGIHCVPRAKQLLSLAPCILRESPREKSARPHADDKTVPQVVDGEGSRARHNKSGETGDVKEICFVPRRTELWASSGNGLE